MPPEALVIPRFKGIHRPGFAEQSSIRRNLDEPREMYNFHITSQGHLFMPKAAEELWDLSSETGENSNSEVRSIHYVERPRGIVVQSTSGRIYHIGIESPSIDPPSPLIVNHLATMGTGEEEWPLWINGTSLDYFLMGYGPRGSAGPDGDGRTWKVSGDWNNPTVDDLSSVLTPSASYSILYKGRRLWVLRGRTVYFSELDQYEEERPENNWFVISGNDAGESHLANPGFVQGMAAWEDVCFFFLLGSVWLLTGSDPATDWSLRQVTTIVGNRRDRSIVRIDEGVITYGGVNLNSPSFYLFTGQNSVDLGLNVQDWLKEDDSGEMRSATYSGNKYIVSVGREDVNERQFLLYDLDLQQWTAFDGFVRGASTTQWNRVLIGSGPKVYRMPDIMFPRYPGRGSRITLGYSDDENPTGMQRFLGLKISGRKWGSGISTVTVTATTPEDSITTDPIDIPTDVFDGLLIPINIRGSALELQLEFTAPSNDNELLIENLQLVRSVKGEKLSRV